MSIEPIEAFSISTRYLTFGAKRWGSRDGLPVLALHGWLDNASSFDRLAPCLPDLHLVALDLAGHGLSDHRPPGVKYHYVDYIDDVLAVADALDWERFALLGHSLGAGLASVLAGSFPERVTHLMLIEGIGPMSREAERSGEYLSKSVREMQQFGNKRLPVYPGIDAAVAARTRVGDMAPASVEILVRRNLAAVNGGVQWRSDPRLKLASPLYMSEKQVHGFLRGIRVPVLLIRGEDGLLRHLGRLEDRKACIAEIQEVLLAGGHHLHLDDPEPVARVISAYLSNGIRPGD